MSRGTAESLSVGLQRLKGSAETWEPRPRDPRFRVQFAWLLLVVKMICLQNTNWLLSAAIHAALTLCIAGVALHQHTKASGVGINGGLFDGEGDGDGFENVLGDNQPSGGGGTPFETASAAELVGIAQQANELAGLNELARLGREGSDEGDGGEGGGSGGGSGTGRGRGSGPGVGLGAGFFGSKGKGKSFVYVVDCSGSMYGERFRRAKTELVRSINKL